MPTIEIDDDLHGLLHRPAQREHESHADVLRCLLRTYCEKSDAPLEAYKALEQDTS